MASATGAMLFLPKLLRSRLILIATRCIPCFVGRGTVVCVLRVCCATCGIAFPFFYLWSSANKVFANKVLHFGRHVFLTYKLGVHEPAGITQRSGTCVGRSAEMTEVSKRK